MQLGQIIEALRNDLVAVAAVGDERTAGIAERLSIALEGSLGLRLVDAFAAAALELNAQLPGGHVEVRLAGRDPELVYIEEELAEPHIPAGADDEALARISLRLPEALKRTCEEAAARDGVSLNTWIIRALARAQSGEGGRRQGKRLTGYARS